MTIPQVPALVTGAGPPHGTAGGIVASSTPARTRRAPGAPAFMRALKQFDGLPWEKMVIALAVSAIAAWSLGWIAGTIVSFIFMR